MGISIDFAAIVRSLGSHGLSADDKRQLEENGALDGSQVYFEFLTENDASVRPAHRALHGTVWKVGDPEAPVPPLDYGCRCCIRYVGRPGTLAARLLPEAPAAPTTRGAAFAAFLDDKLPNWREIARKANGSPSPERMGEVVLAVQEDSPDLSGPDARNYAQMILQADTQP